MKRWTYQPASALQLPLEAQLSVFPRERDLTHTVLRTLWTVWLRVALRLYFRLEIRGREQLPTQGSYVLVANHSSHLDAVALSCVLPVGAVHRAFAAAAKEYFFSSVWRSFFSAVFINAIPFDRINKKRESLELCADVLDVADHVLIMFPEGTRSASGEIQPFKKGIGILTAGTARQVVPAYLDGAHAAWPKGSIIPKPKKVRVVLGRPMVFSRLPRTEEAFVQVAAEVERAVRGLHAQPRGRR